VDSQRRWTRAYGATGLVALVVAVFCGLVAWRLERFIDLQVYRMGAEAVLDGHVYDVHLDIADLPFTYPPFSALLMVPLTWLPFWAGVAVTSFAGVVALALTVGLVLRTCPPTPAWVLPAVVGAAVLSEPVWATLSFGQVNLLLMAAVTYDVLRSERRTAGWLLGVAAGVKLTPLVLVAFLVLTGRIRAAAVAVLTFAATVAVAAVAAPQQSRAYWSEVLWDPSRIGGVGFAGNQSVNGMLSRVLGHEAGTGLWFAVASAVAGATLLVAAAVWRSALPTGRPLGLCLAAIAMLFASPISWNHHWVWAVPTAVALWLTPWRWARPAAVAWTALFFSHAIWWAPFRYDKEYDWGVLEHVPGDSYVWVSLVLVAAVAVSLRSDPGRDVHDRPAVHGELRAGREGGLVAREEDHEARDLLDPAGSAERDGDEVLGHLVRGRRGDPTGVE
jgi:alpha-1,2-mannosyltransferase